MVPLLKSVLIKVSARDAIKSTAKKPCNHILRLYSILYYDAGIKEHHDNN